MLPETADAYLADGCGRCDQYQTPTCKVHTWHNELVGLRALALATGMREEVKWGSPCYTLDGGNVVMVTAFREFACLSFFKGTLLDDPQGLLEAPGPNSQAMRLLKVRSVEELAARQDAARAFLAQAVELERAGAKVEMGARVEPVPDELQALLDADPALAAAFAALTPGRRRSHVLHVAGAKSVAARSGRAEKCAEKIRAGKGFLDR